MMTRKNFSLAAIVEWSDYQDRDQTITLVGDSLVPQQAIDWSYLAVARAKAVRGLRPQPIKPYFQDEWVTLFNADYREILPQLGTGSVDLVLTDPPYATTNLPWDKAVDWPFFWGQADRIAKLSAPMVLFSSGKFTILLINTNLKNFRYEIIWEKNMPVGYLDAKRRPLRCHENVLVFARKFKASVYNPQMTEGPMHKRGSTTRRAPHYSVHEKNIPVTESNLYYPRSVWRFSNTRQGKSLHPTQKPLEMMERLAKTFSNRGDLILDPFAGSGTTLQAARNCGKRAVGVELNEEYCEVIARRLERGDE